MGDIGSEGGIGMERGRERQMGFVARRAVPDTQRGGVVLGVDLGLVVLGAELGVLGVDLGLVALGAELGDIVLGEGAPDIPNTGYVNGCGVKIKSKSMHVTRCAHLAAVE